MTDTEILDWLERNRAQVYSPLPDGAGRWAVATYSNVTTATTLREAVEKAAGEAEQ